MQYLEVVDLNLSYIPDITLDYLKKTLHNVFAVTTNIQGGVL